MKLTDKIVRDLCPPPRGKQTKVYETGSGGFGVRVTSTGARSFILNYTSRGREHRLTIGTYPTWSVSAARERMRLLRRQIDADIDPLAPRTQRAARQTVAQLWSRYASEVLLTKSERTIANETSMWRRLILPRIGSKFIEDVLPEHIDALHLMISRTTPFQANRALASLRFAFSKAIRWRLVTSNPAIGVSQNREPARERYLTVEERKRFVAALDSRPDTPTTLALRLLLLTGCRKTEALAAPWSQFDLTEGVWFKPAAFTKQKAIHRVPLSEAALQVLKRARTLSDSHFVFPGSGRSGHIVEIKTMFRQICKQAEIEDFRTHDLRHSYASVLASSGTSFAVNGRLLGHTQIATTQRYSHLFDDVLREATERASRGHLGSSDHA